MNRQPEYVWDVFISHADADSAWVEGYLLDALVHAGLRCQSESVFELGKPRLLEFERAVQQSHYTLLIISSAFLAGTFTEFADLLAESYGRETSRWPVIPLLREKVKLPPRLAMLVSLDMSEPSSRANAIERLCATLRPPSAVDLSSSQVECPYLGMIPFEEDQCDRFFGRESETQAILKKLHLHPFLTVIGRSGSGKSSLVSAGVVPALAPSSLFGQETWLTRKFRPGLNPLDTLRQILGFDPEKPEQAIQNLLATEKNAHRIFLFIDQFEEVFSPDVKQADLFQTTLLSLAQVPNCFVILTVRSDFYGNLQSSPLWREIDAHHFDLLPLDAKGLRDAITKPAEQVGVFIEAALVERLVADAEGKEGILPFVQETLFLMWPHLERRFLPLQAYDSLVSSDGTLVGLKAAIALHADETLSELSTQQQSIARHIFLQLVDFVQGRDPVRRQQSTQALMYANDPMLFEQTLQHLTQCRLLTLTGEKADGDRKVDLVHETLFTGWPQLRQWIEEAREWLPVQRRLSEAATEWVKQKKDRGYLFSGSQLNEAKKFSVAHPGELNQQDQAFLKASQSAHRTSRIQQIALGVSILVLALVTGIFLWSGPLAPQMHWTLVQDIGQKEVTNLEAGENGVLYAGIAAEANSQAIPCVYRSDNSGITWKALSLTGKSVFALYADVFNHDVVYASLGTEGLYRSANRGESWDKLVMPPSMRMIEAMTTSPDGILFVGDNILPVGVSASLDNGNTWETLKGTPKVPVHFLRWESNRLLVGTPNGLFKWSPDGNWTRLIKEDMDIQSVIVVPDGLVAGGERLYELREGGSPRQISDKNPEILSIALLNESIPHFVAANSKGKVLEWRWGDSDFGVLDSGEKIGSPRLTAIRIQSQTPLRFLIGTKTGMYVADMRRELGFIR